MTYTDAEKRANLQFVTQKLATRFGRYVDTDDIYQHLAEYAYGPGATELERWHAKNEPHRIYLALFGVGREWAERAKAAASGYCYEDVAWYSPASLKELIPLALDPTFDGQTGVEYGQITGSAVASTTGTLLAMIVDVRRALAACPTAARDVAVYDDESDAASVARLVLSDWLGGDAPAVSYGKPRRQVLSNAAAVSLLAREG